MLDSKGERWLTAEHEPVDVDVSEWNEYTVIAQGNRLIHTVNGQLSSELIDVMIQADPSRACWQSSFTAEIPIE